VTGFPSKPPTKAVPQTREPKSIRFTPDEWVRITTAGQRRGEDEPAVFVRKLTLYALRMVEAQAEMEASGGVLRQIL